MKQNSRYAFDIKGTISDDGKVATVANIVFFIGEKIPYKNTHGFICYARIVEFKKTEKGTVWFTGKNENTNADVYYPLHGSLDIITGSAFNYFNYTAMNP